jgi:predicted alpha/beta superfamily hydrolase
MKFQLMISSVLAATLLHAQQPVQINITELPAYHKAGTPIYIAGSFNGWNPASENFQMHFENGHYTLQLPAGTRGEFKLTTGSWDKVECSATGQTLENRIINQDQTQLDVKIAGWQDHFATAAKVSTASNHVKVISKAFAIPQLNRTRPVWIYLPASYAQDKKKRYPVIYMHDGQNVFDAATSYAGEWGVDEYLDSTKKEFIVVAIAHGDEKRMTEYNPYNHGETGKGEGYRYLEFIAKTLKPYIDKSYRTKSDKAHTSIAGSSMGGLISFYAVLKYPNIFGTAGVFSPSFWITNSAVYKDVKALGKKINSNIYFYAGKEEGDGMVTDMLKVFGQLSTVSKSRMTSVIRDGARHNEAAWRKELPSFFEWMSRHN